jgi:putative FmdB family regulatory protein
MPLYEFECDACGERFEVIQKFSDPTPDVCEKCGKGPVRKLMSSPAIQFKGSGFYITDYAQKGKSDSGSGGSSGSKGKSDSGKSDSSGGESKSDSAASKDTSAKSDAPASSSSSTTTSTPKKD